MSESPVVVLAAIIMVAAGSMALGHSVAQEAIATDCQKLERVVINGKAYECRLLEIVSLSATADPEPCVSVPYSVGERPACVEVK